MILAGDVGGTKTHLGLFSEDAAEPLPLVQATYASREAAGFESLLRRFFDALGTVSLDPSSVHCAAFGIAGPVTEGRVEATNLPWTIDARALERSFGLERVELLNDLEANAHGISVLRPDQLETLQAGARAAGNRGVISAGTGLGQAGLYWDGRAHRPFASEGGHVDFAPRNETEEALLRWLRAHVARGRVSYERIVCGPGLVNVYNFFRATEGGEEPAALREAMTEGDPAAAIARWAMEGRSSTCERALDLFVSVFGAAAGNLALQVLAVGGIYVGGGIAPKILPRLRERGFLEAFLDKGRLRDLVERVPVQVVLESDAAFLGAASRARELARESREHSRPEEIQR